MGGTVWHRALADRLSRKENPSAGSTFWLGIPPNFNADFVLPMSAGCHLEAGAKPLSNFCLILMLILYCQFFLSAKRLTEGFGQ